MKKASHKDPIGLHFMKCPEQANLQRSKIDQWLPRAEEGYRVGRKGGVTVNGYGSWAGGGGNEYILKLTILMTAQLCKYTKNH